MTPEDRADPDGGAPMVVLVPGLGLDGREWAGVWPLLSVPSTVVALPAMGRRAPAGSDLTVEAHVDRLTSLLPPGRGELVLVGHSASCQVVAETATRHPRVRAVVLVGPTTDPNVGSWPRLVTRWLRTARHERPWEVRVLAPQYARTGLWGMARGMDRMRHHRTDRALSRVLAGVVVVRGEHDHIADAPWCSRLAALCGGTVTTVPDAGHMVPLTHPAAVADAIELLLPPGGAC